MHAYGIYNHVCDYSVLYITMHAQFGSSQSQVCYIYVVIPVIQSCMLGVLYNYHI